MHFTLLDIEGAMSMFTGEKKLSRLIEVAKMYYEKDMTQGQIASKIGISRPMVSKLLTEAREIGVVTIHITSAKTKEEILSQHMQEVFGLNSVVVIKTAKNPADTNELMAKKAYEIISSVDKREMRLGIGWGSMIGKLIEQMERGSKEHQVQGSEAFPLIGGIKASYRSYHTNELVRIFADKMGMNASYLYMPAIFDTEEAKEIVEATEMFGEVRSYWDYMTHAIVNISNFPSAPDLATAYCFGDKLYKREATGHILAYYYDIEGNIISPNHNVVMQIRLEQLKRAKHILALCSAVVRPESLIGALHTGIITDLIVDEDLASAVLQLKKK